MDEKGEFACRRLAPRASEILMHAVGREVRCLSGRIWLTQYGDRRDIVLGPGQCFVLSLPNVVVMAAGKEAVFALGPREVAMPPCYWLRRIAGWFDPRHGSTVLRPLRGRVAFAGTAPPCRTHLAYSGEKAPAVAPASSKENAACLVPSSNSGSSSPAPIPISR